ncbi:MULTISPECIES: thaumatin family protein [Streptomyces]|uniref:thaumatin family protein n=1 Tax=Streptomyces TaxID=1883 RepID=UPI0011A922C3|nr:MULTISPECIES: thaumatin family protein [Streptomyces]
MTTVVLHSVDSADGFTADPGDDVRPPFDWYGRSTPGTCPTTRMPCTGRPGTAPAQPGN